MTAAGVLAGRDPDALLEGVFTSADGVEIYFNVIGSGPPVFLCDGIGCDQYAWKYLVPYFQKTHTLVRWNYRGHGKSGTPNDFSKLGMEHVRSDLANLVDHLGVEQAMFVGHSMGVQVVLDFAVHHPEKVKGLSLVCGSFGRPLKTFHDNDVADKVFPTLYNFVTKYPNAVRKFWRALLKTRLPFEIAVRTEVNGDFVLREDFMPYFEHLSGVDPVVFFTMLRSLNAHDLSAELASIDLPVLVVAGEKDTFTPAWLSREMNARIKGSELLFMPGGSHTAPIEFPELLNLRLEKFMRERIK